MKKIISILIISAMITTSLLAFDFSIGAGQIFEQSFRNGSWVEGSLPLIINEEGDYIMVDVKMYEGFKKTSNGGFLFFDTKYAMLDISYARAYISAVWKDAPLVFGALPTEDGAGLVGKMDHLSFSLLGKYPMDMGVFTVFPLLGVNYNYILAFNDLIGDDYFQDHPDYEAVDMSQFGILGGLGADYDLTDTWFLRGQALFNLRFPSKLANDTADEVEALPPPFDLSADNTLGMGYRLSLGLGYRF